MTDQRLQESDWRARYEALAKETLEIYASVYCMLTQGDAEDEVRVARASNELYWAGQSLEARKIFDASEVPRA